MHIHDLETPAIFVDRDILERNITRLSCYAAMHGLNLRPHTKTHKIPEIAAIQIASGCTGITVAKSGEAEVMASRGLDDILIAYPIYGDVKWKRVAELARYKKITVAVDSPLTARALSKAATEVDSTIHLLVENDVGMRRCGVGTAEDAADLAVIISDLPGIHFAGITFYPGHIWAMPNEQHEPMETVAQQIGKVIKEIKARGLDCEIVSGGSTPSAYNSHLLPMLTEIRPGTYVFNDRNTLGAGACSLEDCAFQVLVTVVSNAVSGRAIVDGGSKTFTTDRWFSGTREGHGLLPQYPEIVFESMSEEHGHLNVPSGHAKLEIGTKVGIIPNHVCACVNLHDRIWYHRGGKVEGYWEVAGRGKVQ